MQTGSPGLETVHRLLLKMNCYSQFSCKHLEMALGDRETLQYVPCVSGEDPRVNSKSTQIPHTYDFNGNIKERPFSTSLPGVPLMSCEGGSTEQELALCSKVRDGCRGM